MDAEMDKGWIRKDGGMDKGWWREIRIKETEIGLLFGGAYGTRTRDLRRDRPAF